MRRFFLVVTIALFCFYSQAQDSLYARHCIKALTSKICFGRGYVKNGLASAEKIIVSEIKKSGALPMFNAGYTQSFFHSVNTFPKKCEVNLNGKQLTPGIDFILDPGAAGIKGKFNLQKADSVTFLSENEKIKVQLKNKLTFSVSHEVKPYCGIEINRQLFKEQPQHITVNVSNKLIPQFESRNIACYFEGSLKSDSLLVFSAHYDHLGGMGKRTFFPGANDNASGSSLLLDLIKYYKTHPPKYKTVFIFFAGEEAGLVGSKFFTQSGALTLNKIKFLINLDLLGTGDDGIMVVNGAVYEKEFLLLKKINEESRLVKEVKKRGKAANSDHYWFSEAGVPCFFIYTLGGVTAYHDVKDIEKTLPLTDYMDVFRLITQFMAAL